jgi:heme exporter protein CcmD
MNDIAHFLAMGRYGIYVWPAYGLTVLVFAWMLAGTVATRRARRREDAELAALARPRRARREVKS